MYYTIYKTTNLINGKIYIGAHKTSDLNDGYFGSGKLINLAVEKYGIEHFKTETLHFLDNEEEMFLMEAELVTEEFIKEDTNYNLKVGGEGGFDYINNHTDWNGFKYINENSLNNIANQHRILLDRIKYDSEYKKSWQERMRNGLKKYYETNDGIFSGKSHTDETKEKMRETHKKNGHAQGEKNSQFGTCWIYNLDLEENKKINKYDLDNWISKGWTKGRKMNF